jgi:hypothetical protein
LAKARAADYASKDINHNASRRVKQCVLLLVSAMMTEAISHNSKKHSH